MADEPENHTIRLLQELRADMTQRFDNLTQRFDDVTMRVDGNTLLLNLLAGLLHQQDERLTALESRRPS